MTVATHLGQMGGTGRIPDQGRSASEPAKEHSLRVYLHIGAHRAGASAIQCALAAVPETLERSGVLYPLAGRPALGDPGPPAHDGLATAILHPGAPDPWPELSRELEASDRRLALLSSAEFDRLRQKPQLAELKRRLDSHEVSVLVYLPRQDELLHDNYRAAVLTGGETRPFGDFRRDGATEGDHGRRLRRWEDVFGLQALIVRPHEQSQLEGGDVVGDLVARLGLPGRSKLRPQPPPPAARSYPRNVIECVRAMRAAGADEAAIADLIEVCGYVYADVDADPDILPPKRRAILMERFGESNHEVARRFLGREDGRLFDDLAVGDQEAWRSKYWGRQADVTVSVDDARAALAHLA